jgi:glycosyltransferase involved in cell wall biosynthesis
VSNSGSQFLTIVVCTYNRATALQRAVDSLQSLIVPKGLQVEILIVDNASTDHTQEVVAQLQSRSRIPVRYQLESIPGVAAARNCGIRSTASDWLAFFDDDQTVDPDWLQALWLAAQRHHTMCVGGTVRLRLPDGFQGELSGVCRVLLSETRPADDDVPYGGPRTPGTGNLLLHRQLLQRVGWFDERVSVGGEDTELYQRIVQSGTVAWFATGAIVYHWVPAERLRREYLLWNARRTGVHVANWEQRRFGKVVYPLRFVARSGQALIKLPRLGKGLLKRDGECGERVGVECLLAAAGAYLRRMGQWYLPRLLSQKRYFEALDFRVERERFGS